MCERLTWCLYNLKKLGGWRNLNLFTETLKSLKWQFFSLTGLGCYIFHFFLNILEKKPADSLALFFKTPSENNYISLVWGFHADDIWKPLAVSMSLFTVLSLFQSSGLHMADVVASRPAVTLIGLVLRDWCMSFKGLCAHLRLGVCFLSTHGDSTECTHETYTHINKRRQREGE